MSAFPILRSGSPAKTRQKSLSGCNNHMSVIGAVLRAARMDGFFFCRTARQRSALMPAGKFTESRLEEK
jgi:hypothetical protein